MHVLHVDAGTVARVDALPPALPASGFVWVGVPRSEFESRLAEVQAALQRWRLGPLVELHVSDLLNAQLRSQFDYTSWYDIMVFRKLAPGRSESGPVPVVDTSPIGFVVFDRVLITVHPEPCMVRAYFEERLAQLGGAAEARGAGSRLPTSPADLMLRMVNHIVDSYLDLRRLLSRQLADLQGILLGPRSRFSDWRVVLDVRNAMSMLEDTCEDQRAAVQEWLDGLEEWPAAADAAEARERELLRVRSRDVVEHIERVLGHVRRLEQSMESAVQMHFAAVSQRTNNIMRTLTVLTAIFLPLNLITGFFGMNFDALPLIHSYTGVWVTVGIMALTAVGLGVFFWRKRYLGTHGQG
jgi:Mg2+ and Co2+ transporter CorA